MKTFRIFWKYEWMTIRRTPYLIGAGALFFLSLLFALANGDKTVEATVVEHTEIKNSMLEKADELKLSAADSKPDVEYTPYDVGTKLAAGYIFKEPSAFAFLSVGQHELFASEYSISLRDQDFSILNGHDHVGNPLMLYLGAFDFAFVILWLLPLLVILYMFNVIAAERENGTLPLLLSQPLSLKQFLWTKLVVKFTVLSVFLLLSMAIGFSLFGFESFSQTPELLLIVFATLLYALFWFGLSAMVNQFGMHSMTNLSSLFLGWLLFVLLVPTGLGLLSDVYHAVPSRLQLVNDLKTGTKEIDNDAASLLDNYYFDHPELAPKGEKRSMSSWVYKNALKRQMVYAAASPVVEDYYSGLQAQGSFMESWQFLSPALMLGTIIDAKAENQLSDVTAFQQQADAARAEWHEIFEPKIFKDEPMTAREVRNLPHFSYQSATNTASISAALLGLITTNVVLLLLIFAIGKYSRTINRA